MTEQPFIVQKHGVPDYRSPEQRAMAEAMAPLLDQANRRMAETLELNFSRDPLSPDSVRCRPADADPVVAPTWQPAYAGPCPNEIRASRNANRVTPPRTLRRRLIDLGDNLLLALATWADERNRRTR